jgi:Zn-dependent protease with chaperone function
MSFLLMVFLTLVCLFDAYQRPWWEAPGWSVLAAALGVLAVGAHAFWVSRRVWGPLARDPSQRETLLARYERGRFAHQVVQIAAFVLVLTLGGWGWTVRDVWRQGDQALPGLELLTLAPFLLSLVVGWLFFYDADRAAHLAVHRLLEGDSFAQTLLDAHRAATSFDGRWGYVAFQLRQKLALVFIPVLLLIVQKEVARLVPASGQHWSLLWLAGIVGLGCVFVSMPLIIRVILGLRPLPGGPLRDRLLAASARLRFRTSDILLWNTRNGMANAMVVGLVPWLRYVVFTDRLLEEFTEDEVEAVFGHEVGHVRHQHMLYYLFFLVASVGVLGTLTDQYVLPALGWQSGVPANQNDPRMVFSVVGVLMVYIFVVFGFLSRRCERQADVFGCRAVSCGDPCCRGHDETTRLAPEGRGLCVTGIQTFIRALEKVALVNGINRERPGFLQSWQHSTIARRVAFLDRVLVDRGVDSRFQRRLGWIKWGLLGLLGLTFAVLFAANGWRL